MISSIINKIKSASSTIKTLAIIGLVWYSYYSTVDSVRHRKDAERNKDNYEYYQNLHKEDSTSNKTLRLTVEEITNSRDSAINALMKLKGGKKGGIGKTKPGDVISGGTISIDVDTTINIVDTVGIELDTTIVFNEMTKSHIKIDSTGLYNKLSIESGFYFEVGARLEYKNERKNWFDRLIRLDYAKRAVPKYYYKFNNEAIKTENFRVIVVE